MTENRERRPITESKIVTKIQKFEDLEVWKEGVRLSVEIYKSLGECKDYSLKIKFKDPPFQFLPIYPKGLNEREIKNSSSFYISQKDLIQN